jgi:predicted TIM-barrel fold metal-dependent hydrolase
MIRTLDSYKKQGVYKVIFFDGPAALQAHNLRPNEIVPSLYVRYMDKESSARDVENALKNGFLWIGEALLRHHGVSQVPADNPVAMRIYDLCAKYNVPITIHQDSADYGGAYVEFEQVADLKRNTTFILHGWWLGSSGVTAILQRHPNVYIELAGELENDKGQFLGGTRQDQFSSAGTINGNWKYVFEKYQDRIINGFDFWMESQYDSANLKRNVDYWRNLFGQIDPAAAEKIAYKNVENLLTHGPSSTTTGTSTIQTTTGLNTSGYVPLGGGIVIDGYSDDWRQLQLRPLTSDPEGDSKGGVSGTDIKSVYAALDYSYLYLMFELYDKVDHQVRVQYCFVVDVDGDGQWDYQPGFDAYGNAWIWNLTGGRDYSDQRNVSTLGGAEAAALHVKLNTNGVLIDNAVAKTLKKCVDEVLLPLHARNAKMEREITHSASFDRKIDAIEFLVNSGVFTRCDTVIAILEHLPLIILLILVNTN